MSRLKTLCILPPFTISIQAFGLMALAAQPNTTHCLVVLMDQDILERIASFVGNCCMVCDKGTAVLIRNGNLWDWACLSCC